jgi:hypothetical protein
MLPHITKHQKHEISTQLSSHAQTLKFFCSNVKVTGILGVLLAVANSML